MEKSQQPIPSPIVIGKNNFAYADGVKIGRFIPERGVLQVVDKDARRCQEKGRTVVEVRISDLINLAKK